MNNRNHKTNAHTTQHDKTRNTRTDQHNQTTNKHTTNIHQTHNEGQSNTQTILYILKCEKARWYCGITDNIQRRIEEHLKLLTLKTHKHKIEEIHCLIPFTNRNAALTLERAIQKKGIYNWLNSQPAAKRHFFQLEQTRAKLNARIAQYRAQLKTTHA